MKTVVEMLAIHDQLRKTCQSVTEFRERWTKAVAEGGWEKRELYDAMDAYFLSQAKNGS